MLIDRALVEAALPHYELGALLGQGASGSVLEGRHRRINRRVAIKILSHADLGTRGRFVHEAEVLAGLDHPHIVRIYDYVEYEELRLLVMEHVSGGTLASRESLLSPHAACAVGLAAAEALTAAHNAGVLHRDVKPSNLLFTSDDILKLADFGISKLFQGPDISASIVAGTPGYMAPEQLTGGRVGPGTDIYGLGVVLYKLLCGRMPYDPTLPPLQLWRLQIQTVPPTPAGVPAPLTGVVMRALGRRLASRHPTADDFACDLAQAADRVFGPGWLADAEIPPPVEGPVRPSIPPYPLQLGTATPTTYRRTGSSLPPVPPPAIPPMRVADLPPAAPVTAGDDLVIDTGPSGTPPLPRDARPCRAVLVGGAIIAVLVAGGIAVRGVDQKEAAPTAAGALGPGPTPAARATDSTAPVRLTGATLTAPPDADAVAAAMLAVPSSGRIAVGSITPSEDTAVPFAWWSDGTSWHPVRVPLPAGSTHGAMRAAAVAEDGRLVAVGFATSDATADDTATGASVPVVWTSTDGHAWQVGFAGPSSDTPAQFTGVVAYRDGLLAVGWSQTSGPGDDGIVWRSADGAGWQRLTAPGLAGQRIDHLVTLADGSLLATGNGLDGSTTMSQLRRSSDGETWRTDASRPPAGALVDALTRLGDGRILAAGTYPWDGTGGARRPAVWIVDPAGRTWKRYAVPPGTAANSGLAGSVHISSLSATDGSVLASGYVLQPDGSTEAATWTLDPPGTSW